MNDLLTTNEAGKLLGRSPFTVLHYVNTGRLEVAMQAPGSKGAKFYRRADVEKLAAEIGAPA